MLCLHKTNLVLPPSNPNHLIQESQKPLNALSTSQQHWHLNHATMATFAPLTPAISQNCRETRTQDYNSHHAHLTKYKRPLLYPNKSYHATFTRLKPHTS